MGLFSFIDGAQVVTLHKDGVFKQLDLFSRDDYIFAKHGGGYIRLYAKGLTSNPNIRWEHIEGVNYKQCDFERLRISNETR